MTQTRNPNSRRRVATLAFAVAAALLPARPASALFGVGDIVFDPKNFAQHLLILQQHAEQLAQLRAQAEQIDRALKDWDFSRVDETLQRMARIGDTLDQIGGSLGRLDERFPDNWSSADPHDADGTINPRQRQWRIEQRTRAEQAVKLHEEVAESIAETRGRVAEYVERSNAAPGQLAAQQATNELLAVQVQQLQELQALEIAALRADVERQAARASAGEWQHAHLRGDGDAASAEEARLAASPGPTGGTTTPQDRPTVGQYRAALTGR